MCGYLLEQQRAGKGGVTQVREAEPGPMGAETGERLGYVCNPRSLKEGTETSRRRTDELGSLPKGHGYCPFQCPVEASCAVIFWRRLGPP